MPREFQFEYLPLRLALRRLAHGVKVVGGTESIRVDDNAYGRVLGTDIHAGYDVPLRATSHFDGFAVRHADVENAKPASQVSLRLTGRRGRIGKVPGRLEAGRAMPLPTGAYLPDGADTVIPIEDARVEKDRLLLVSSPVKRGQHVYPAGQDVRKGELVLRAGKELKAADLVLLASLGFKSVQVRSKPRVAIVPTGSELTDDLAAASKHGKVYETHSMLIARLVEEAGGTPVRTPIVRDDLRALRSRIMLATQDFDIVLTLAGSSMGHPDLVESAIRATGKAEILVHGVAVHRGRVMGFAIVNGKPLVMLPGPIQACLNAFSLFGFPLIRNHLGRGFEEPPVVNAVSAEDWEAHGKFAAFAQMVYVGLRRGPDRIEASPETAETEKISFLVSKGGYVLLEANNEQKKKRKMMITKGQSVWVHLLPGLSAII